MIYSCYSHTRSHTLSRACFPAKRWNSLVVKKKTKKSTLTIIAFAPDVCDTHKHTFDWWKIPFSTHFFYLPNANVKNYDKNICFPSARCRADKWLCLIFRLFVFAIDLRKEDAANLGQNGRVSHLHLMKWNFTVLR